MQEKELFPCYQTFKTKFLFLDLLELVTKNQEE